MFMRYTLALALRLACVSAVDLTEVRCCDSLTWRDPRTNRPCSMMGTEECLEGSITEDVQTYCPEACLKHDHSLELSRRFCLEWCRTVDPSALLDVPCEDDIAFRLEGVPCSGLAYYCHQEEIVTHCPKTCGIKGWIALTNPRCRRSRSRTLTREQALGAGAPKVVFPLFPTDTIRCADGSVRPGRVALTVYYDQGSSFDQWIPTLIKAFHRNINHNPEVNIYPLTVHSDHEMTHNSFFEAFPEQLETWEARHLEKSGITPFVIVLSEHCLDMSEARRIQTLQDATRLGVKVIFAVMSEEEPLCLPLSRVGPPIEMADQYHQLGRILARFGSGALVISDATSIGEVLLGAHDLVCEVH